MSKVATVNWELLFEPSEWYITPEVITEHWLSLAVSFGVVAVAFIFFLIARSMGTGSKWFKSLKWTKISMSQPLFLSVWAFFYIPLAIGAWLVAIQQNYEWTRAMTVYSAHLAVSALFAVSFYWVQDISLALLNIITLLGVAMFVSTQFEQVLPFAATINTPYLFWLVYLLIDFSWFWYVNEGKDALDINTLKGIPKKVKVVGMTDDVKETFRSKIAEDKAAAKEVQTAKDERKSLRKKKTE